MDEQGFRAFCTAIQLDEETIQANIHFLRIFDAFLKENSGQPDFHHITVSALQPFIAHLIQTGMNTQENFLGLIRYARFTRNRDVEVGLLELLDGSDILEQISDAVRQAVGANTHRAIFEGITLPPLGTLSKDKPPITRKFMEQLQKTLDAATYRPILAGGFHARPKEAYLPEREKFLASKGLDEYLKRRHQEYLEVLAKHMREQTLYFTQEIDESVLEYVRNTPTCQSGVRDGNRIYLTKIPYMTKQYLHEQNETMKRYYYCHCPWVREAIRTNLPIPPDFCYCSAGYDKRPWEVIFDQPVQVEVLETVLNGDFQCKFAIHIPREFLTSPGPTPKEE